MSHYFKWNLLPLFALFFSCSSLQKPDNDFDVSVTKPAFINHHPKVLFDEAHHNMHTATGTYAPFVHLITNDGCEVVVNSKPFSAEGLKGVDIIVISNAKGGKNDLKYMPAFSEEENTFVRDWVKQGGALLLIADHYPFGSAAEGLSQQFGVHMFNGETTDTIHYSGSKDGFRDKLIFSWENKLLVDNEITKGRSEEEFLNRIVSDRGQSLSIPDSAIVLLQLSKSSFHALPDSIWNEGATTYTNFADPVSAYGNCQALALKFGKGRVVILGEASMITAQTYEGEKFGMNTPGNDNKQFTLNIFHWLLPDKKLGATGR